MRFLLFILLIIAANVNGQNTSIQLNKNWQFFHPSTKKWYPAEVPGTIHTDLLASKLIPDPFYRDHETKLQWIDSSDWDYKNSFNVDAATFSQKNIELVFDGLDTYADVYLNGKLILQAENMFRQYSIPVKNLLKRTGNELKVHFSSALNKVDSIAKSRLPLILPDNNRVYTRKAQYHFGWDWGPKFIGCGIWKGMRLESWNEFKILNAQVVFQRTNKDTAFAKVKMEVWADKEEEVALVPAKTNGDIGIIFYPPLSGLNTNGVIPGEISLKLVKGINKLEVDPAIIGFSNWGIGNKTKQETVELYLMLVSKKETAMIMMKTGVRQISLIRQPDSIGQSFYFQLNGKPVFAKGANYIPSDVFLPRLKKEDYRKVLQSAKDANMNMLRVWGGGVYESDDFYDLCDSMGIMVWQDFMFACGMYPGDEHFFSNVREEVKYQIERLRNHPCIVLWCGNNEVDEAWHNWGWQTQFNLHGNDSAKVWNDYKRLFKDSLQKWVDEFDGTRPYVSTSPQNGWGHKESFAEGDSHYWGLWWGLEDWEVFRQKTGRFVSEYGMQAMPNMQTIESFTLPNERNRRSAVIQLHQKASEGFKKLDHYLLRYFTDQDKIAKLSLEDYTYLTQCLQYYILKNSIAIHRSKAPNTMGTLLWQLNDCWPVASWSITDYSRQPKAAWYAVREAYRDDVLPKNDTVYPKDLHLQKPVIKYKVQGNKIIVGSDLAAKFVYIDASEAGLIPSDNYFDLQAGEVMILDCKKIPAVNKIATKPIIKIKSLYDVIK